MGAAGTADAEGVEQLAEPAAVVAAGWWVGASCCWRHLLLLRLLLLLVLLLLLLLLLLLIALLKLSEPVLVLVLFIFGGTQRQKAQRQACQNLHHQDRWKAPPSPHKLEDSTCTRMSSVKSKTVKATTAPHTTTFEQCSPHRQLVQPCTAPTGRCMPAAAAAGSLAVQSAAAGAGLAATRPLTACLHSGASGRCLGLCCVAVAVVLLLLRQFAAGVCAARE